MMNATIPSALAILMLAVMAADAPAVEPPDRSARAARHTAEPTRQPIVGRLIDKLLGKPPAEASPPESNDSAADDEAPADGSAAVDPRATAEPQSSLMFSRRVPASATPAIDLDAPRIRLVERPGGAASDSPSSASRALPPTQAVIELDETVVAAPSSDGSMPRRELPEGQPTGPAPPSIAIKTPLPAAAQITSKPAPSPPAAPVITARPAPAPVAVETPAPVATASAVVPKPRRPLTATFLADDVRFGPVMRRTLPSPAASEDDGIEPEVIEPSSPPPARIGARLHVLPPPLAPPSVSAEDFASREPLRPVTSASTAPSDAEIITAAAVSPSASPGDLLQVVHSYGAPREAVALAPVALPASSLPTTAPPPPVAPPRSDQARSIQSTPPQEPTLAETPAAPLIETAPAQQQAAAPARASTRRAVRGKVLHGRVSRVHTGGGYATVEFPDGLPSAGSRASVYRRQLFQRKHLGDVELFVNSAGQMCVRPQGPLKINQLASEDELIVLPQIVDGNDDTQATEPAPQL